MSDRLKQVRWAVNAVRESGKGANITRDQASAHIERLGIIGFLASALGESMEADRSTEIEIAHAYEAIEDSGQHRDGLGLIEACVARAIETRGAKSG